MKRIAEIASILVIFFMIVAKSSVAQGVNIVVLSNYNTPGTTNDLAIAGDYAYLASTNGGLNIININDPEQPFIAGFYNTFPALINRIAVAGDYVYAAGSSLTPVEPDDPQCQCWEPESIEPVEEPILPERYISFFNIVDVSNPASPTIPGNLMIQGEITDISLKGDYAFVTVSDSCCCPGEACSDIEYGGLRIIDISDPTNPQVVGLNNGIPSALAIALVDHYAYVTTHYGLFVLDISEISNPIIVNSSISVSCAWDLAFYDDHLYLTDMYKFYAIDISDRTNPSIVGFCDTVGLTYSLALADNYAFVVGWGADLQTIDISNPSSPSIAGTFPSLSGERTIKLRSGLGCVPGTAHVLKGEVIIASSGYNEQVPDPA